MLNFKKSVSTLLNNKPAVLVLLIRSFLNFPLIPQIRRAE